MSRTTPRPALSRFLIGLVFSLAILAAAPMAEAVSATIDVQFSNGTAFSGAAVVGTTGDIWNVMPTASGGPTALKTVSGAASGATITWSANGLFSGGGGGFSSTAYANLMSHYLYNGSSSKTISFAGLTPNFAYTVYLYTQGDVASGGRQTKAAPALGVPAITSATSAGGTYGSAFSYTIAASAAATTSAATSASASTFISGQNYLVISTGTDSSGNLSLNYSAATGETDINGLQLVAGSAIAPQTYSVTGTLPTGLSLNTSTGVISGTPTQTGSFPVTLGVSNSFGSNTQSLAIAVAKATASVTVNNATVTYDGTQKSLTVGTSPSGLAVSVTYNGNATPPTTVGTYNVAATVTDSNYTGSGTGTLVINQAAPSLSWSQPSAVTYGTALGSTQLNATANVAGTFVYSPLSGAVLTAGSQTLNATFTPTDTTDYTTATAAVTLTVNKAAPVLTWAPSAITYGTGLGAAQLNATANAAGTFVYSPLSGAVLTAGSQTLNATFTPTDTTNYTTATAAVTLTVNKATPTITWKPGSIANGAALTSTQLNATASIAGTFAYSPAAGTPIGVGSTPVTVTFTPTDTTDYTTATLTVNIGAATVSLSNLSATYDGTPKSALATTNPTGLAVILTYNGSQTPPISAGSYTVVGTINSFDYQGSATGTLTIAKVTPTVTWLAPAAIQSGTALSAAQLNATASVPGTFSYAPAIGAVLNPGTNALTATFTPTDNTNYATVTAGVSLTVTAATPAASRLVNISTRAGVGSGQNILLGFVIAGPGSDKLLLRGVGPGLSGFGVPGVLAGPTLQLLDGTGKLLVANSGWAGDATLSATFSQVGAFPLSPTSNDAAAVATLQPGNYSMLVTNGGSGSGGIALAEIYDTNANSQSQYPRLVNISARGPVTGGAGALGVGFVLAGNATESVLIRGIGPTLGSFGVSGALATPLLSVYNSTGTIIAQNQNWGTPIAVSSGQGAASASTLAATAASVGAFPLAAGSNDSALIVTLAPGVYTAQLSGVAGAAGAGMIEVYEVK